MKKIREIFQLMTAAGEAEDVKKTLELKSNLYNIILEGCGNRLIGQLLSQLHNRAMLLRRTSLSEPSRLLEMLHEISTLLDAFAAHDPKAAWSISVHHINQAKRAALKVMRQNELERGPVRRRRGPDAKAEDRSRSREAAAENSETVDQIASAKGKSK
jgi:DNA-binding GntR family transcriptional regulator